MVEVGVPIQIGVFDLPARSLAIRRTTRLLGCG